MGMLATRLPLHPGEDPITRASALRRARQEATILFTQYISSQSTQPGRALKIPATEKLQICRKGRFPWAEGLPPSPTQVPK